MQKWDYRTMSGTPIFNYSGSDQDNIEAMNQFLVNMSNGLRKLGNEGWEVVSSHVYKLPPVGKNSVATEVLTYTLKRPADL